MTNILSVQSSARQTGSFSRDLSAKLIGKLKSAHPGATVTDRDAASGIPLLDEDWLAANWTPADQRTEDHGLKLALSETLVSELEAADIVVIGAPMYNFGVPGALKAWIDMIARAGRTFRYTENGPEGLLKDKKAYVVVTSGGVPVQSGYDHVTPYMKQVLGFVGITDVTFIVADELVNHEERSLNAANDAIAKAA